MTEEPTEFTHTEGQMTGEGPYHATPTPLDAAWEALWLALGNEDAGPAAIIARHRPLIEAEARATLDVECPHCVVIHEWPCPTIPRCDEPGCEQEATCGWPSDVGYRRTCGGHYRAALAAIAEGAKP